MAPTRRRLAWGVLSTLALSLGACGGASANVRPGPMPEGGNFTGVWYSPQYGELHMVQTGNAVIGEYTDDNDREGQIEGTVSGDVLRFEWSEERELVPGRPVAQRGRGYFRYLIGEDEDHYIQGEWGYGAELTGGGPWRARRLRNREPQVSRGGTTEPAGGAGPAPSSSDDEELEQFDTRDDSVEYDD
ncbi:MAG: hypothetical protein ACFCGT_06795 [Sandaracinaceae bacterium]